jgi:hypothetical protein
MGKLLYGLEVFFSATVSPLPPINNTIYTAPLAEKVTYYSTLDKSQYPMLCADRKSPLSQNASFCCCN